MWAFALVFLSAADELLLQKSKNTSLLVLGRLTIIKLRTMDIIGSFDLVTVALEIKNGCTPRSTAPASSVRWTQL